ncbi:MAG: TonB-dependent receptor [Gemmatimonadota bacterium]|nr:TonB-dependent receptor [Gemmatimonadota bacterium]
MKSMARVALAGVLSLLISGAGQATQAQESTGRIVGKVVDASTGRAIGTAQVVVTTTGRQVLTDLEGRFFLDRVPAGSHTVRASVLGYGPKEVTDVRVLAGQSTSLDISLAQTAIEIEAITVTATMESGATASLLDRQRNAAAVTEAVGSQEIARSPDSDAAEVAARVSGVTVAEGRYVYIRGLGERYSQTSLNGSPIPSPEPEKEVVPLDLFPAEFIESLTTQKTYTPDRPGEFSGGSVDIVNRDFPSEFTWKLSLGSSVNTESQFQDGFLRYQGSGTDWLGIDDGARSVPGEVEDAGLGVGGTRLPANDPATVQAAGQAFARRLPQFAPTTKTNPANVDVGASIGDRTTLFGKDFGYFIAGNYGQKFLQRQTEFERKWRAAAFDPQFADASSPNVDLAFERGMREVAWGGLANFSFLASPANQLDLQAMLNRNTDDEARLYTGPNREDLGAETFSERLRFQERSLLWGQLSGKHELGGLNSRVDWRFAAARADREEPALRETVYTRTFGTSEPFTLNGDTGESGRYFYTDLVDEDLSAGLDWTWDFGGFESPASLKVGGAWRDRTRDFAARRFRWNFTSGITSLDDVIANGVIVGTAPRGPNELQLTDIVEAGDQYDADEQTVAGYAMFDVALGGRLRAVFGARIESYELDLTTPDGLGGAVPLSDLSETDVLPSLSLTYALGDAMNLRAAGSRTVDRPEFRELAPFQFTEASSLRQLRGNPDLVVADIWSADLKWEWFPRAGEVLSLGAFYKYLDRPIEQVFFAAASSLYSFQNADDGYLAGLEASVRKRLDFSDFWSHFTLGAGFSVIDSEVNVIAEGGFNPTNLSRSLQGQSPFTVNGSLLWMSAGGDTELGLFYAVFGERIEAAGGSGVPDIELEPRHQIDFTLRQRLTPAMSVKLKAENLLDEPFEWTQSANGITRTQRFYEVGQTFSVSLSYGG